MNLKDKIEEILAKERYTFAQLAEYLHLSEAELARALEDRTLELRYLEEISKNLKVPLYSFFRSGEAGEAPAERPHFIHKLWETDEEQSPQKLQEEILWLRQALAAKEAALRKWTES